MQQQKEEFQFKAPTYLRVSRIIAYVMYAWVMIGIILLGFRIFLLATSANATTPFVEFVYKTSADYMNPFRGIFPTKPVSETGYLDIAAVFAIIMYMLLGWGFSELISFVQQKIDKSKHEQYILSKNETPAIDRPRVSNQASKKTI